MKARLTFLAFLAIANVVQGVILAGTVAELRQAREQTRTALSQADELAQLAGRFRLTTEVLLKELHLANNNTEQCLAWSRR